MESRTMDQELEKNVKTFIASLVFWLCYFAGSALLNI